MTDNTISFEEATKLLAEAKALSLHEAQVFIHEAISQSGVKIHNGNGNTFCWNDRPGKISLGNGAGSVDFDVFKVGNGWRDLDFSARPPIQRPSSYGYSASAFSGKHYGHDEAWTYDRANLAAAIERIFSWRIKSIEVASSSPTDRNKVGRKANPFRDECVAELRGYFRAQGLPTQPVEIHDEIRAFMNRKGSHDGDPEFPAETTRKDWIKLITAGLK